MISNHVSIAVLLILVVSQAAYGGDKYQLAVKGSALSQGELADMNSEMNTKYGGGLRISEIELGSVAVSPLREGDVLLGVGGFQTESEDELEAVLTKVFSDGVIKAKFFVVRDMQTLAGWIDLAGASAKGDLKLIKPIVKRDPKSASALTPQLCSSVEIPIHYCPSAVAPIQPWQPVVIPCGCCPCR